MILFYTEITGSAFGTRENRRFTFSGPANLRAGINKIALLSIAIGLPVSLLNFCTTEFKCSNLLFVKEQLDSLHSFTL